MPKCAEKENGANTVDATLLPTVPTHHPQSPQDLAVNQSNEMVPPKTSGEPSELDSKQTLTTISVEKETPSLKSPLTAKRELRYTKSLKVNDMHLFLNNEMPFGSLYTHHAQKTLFNFTANNKNKSKKTVLENGSRLDQARELVFNGAVGETVDLNINTNWEENTKEIQQITSQWRQIQQDKLLENVLKLIEALLEHPEQTFRLIGPLEKCSVQLPDNVTRFINFFNLLEEIRFATQDCTLETKTKAWFAMNLDGSSLNDHLSIAEIRYFPDMMSSLVEKFLTALVIEERLNKEALTAKFNEIWPQFSPNSAKELHHITEIVLEAAKERFIQQVKEDLIAMRNGMDRIDFSKFQQIKYLTIEGSLQKSGNTVVPKDKLQDEKFLNVLRMLKAIEFPNLEGIVIEDFSVFQNKSKLAQLFLLIEKNQQTLQKITILKGYASDEIVSFRSRLEAFSNITLNVGGHPTPSPQPEKMNFKFFKRPTSRHDERDTNFFGTRYSPPHN
ncbi:hypothetical protein OQJ19_04605 [Fluoribacter gormanii]|uniref:hypothetical protein n=1 Tax=Fluoribacter gormanii TaxID=464 RepID=UPI002242EEF2|nr:hypothetical protein [Fluoribacter gormanii]MCW8469937.1 hypothetical protein [Fluoribacter gormanii]